MTAAISMDDGVLSLWQSSNRLIRHGIGQSGIGTAADCPVHNQTIETVYERRATGWPEEVLGMWVGENESAKLWATVLNGLQNSGVENIFIAYMDNLAGFDAAIHATFS